MTGDNALRRITQAVDPLNHTNLFVYSTNGIDLLETRQVAGAASNLLAQFTYNDQHLPLTAVDAAGQTNWFGYNAWGQLTALTNALGEVTSLE